MSKGKEGGHKATDWTQQAGQETITTNLLACRASGFRSSHECCAARECAAHGGGTVSRPRFARTSPTTNRLCNKPTRFRRSDQAWYATNQLGQPPNQPTNQQPTNQLHLNTHQVPALRRGLLAVGEVAGGQAALRGASLCRCAQRGCGVGAGASVRGARPCCCEVRRVSSSTRVDP